MGRDWPWLAVTGRNWRSWQVNLVAILAGAVHDFRMLAGALTDNANGPEGVPSGP